MDACGDGETKTRQGTSQGINENPERGKISHEKHVFSTSTDNLYKNTLSKHRHGEE